MQTRTASAVLTVLYLTGCAATTPAPRFSAVSPADPDAPEASTPLPAPALMNDEGATRPQPAADGANEGYTCPMHPEVKQASPGSCPRCGMQLVERKGARPQP